MVGGRPSTSLLPLPGYPSLSLSLSGNLRRRMDYGGRRTKWGEMYLVVQGGAEGKWVGLGCGGKGLQRRQRR